MHKKTYYIIHCILIFLIFLCKVNITYIRVLYVQLFRVPLHHISTQFLSKVEDIEKITREMTLHYIKEQCQDAGSSPPGMTLKTFVGSGIPN